LLEASSKPKAGEMSATVSLSGCCPSGAVPSSALGVLLISSNRDLRSALRERLSSQKWRVEESGSGAEALEKMRSHQLAVVLLDPKLPDLRVDEFKEIVREQHPSVAIIAINPHTGKPLPVVPAPDFVSIEVVRHIQELSPLPVTSVSIPYGAKLGVRGHPALPEFIGRSLSVERIGTMVRLVAPRDTTVLITGESGTGKDLVARAVHHLSPRRHKPFVVINCAAIPEALLEAELFGFVKGAFTGAVQSRIGRIHAAQGGTLFLDEIGELPLGLQSKLLRFLEQGEVQRLGSADTFRVDVRVVSATNSNLRQLLEQRRFREDLFYRLSIFPIDLAPLRERREDIAILAEYFLAKYSAHPMRLAPRTSELLYQHSWPGNVRELRNVIERAVILAASEPIILPEHIVL
jgi:DNA-binding NtrC family response regulator